MLRNPLGRFRLIAQVEGASYILLVFIAMPLKYGIGWDLAVRYLGMAHGVLFIAYCLALVITQCGSMEFSKSDRSLRRFTSPLWYHLGRSSPQRRGN